MGLNPRNSTELTEGVQALGHHFVEVGFLVAWQTTPSRARASNVDGWDRGGPRGVRFVTGHTNPVDGGTLAASGWYQRVGKQNWTNRPHNP